MEQYVDVIQIGARNMQNFELLKCVGKMTRPVVVKLPPPEKEIFSPWEETMDGNKKGGMP